MSKRYVKVMFKDMSGANDKLKYKIGKVNVAEYFNVYAKDSKEMGGFNFSTEDKILRWLVRGDTIYNVELPEDAIVIDCENKSAPHGVFRTDKIILTNPRKVTDAMAMEFYLKSSLPDKSYYKALAGCAVRGYKTTVKKIIEDKVNKDNIDLVLEEVNDFIKIKDQVYDKLPLCIRNMYQKLYKIKSGEL